MVHGVPLWEMEGWLITVQGMLQIKADFQLGIHVELIRLQD